MTGEQFLEYTILGVVLAVCIAFMVIKGRRKFGGVDATGCSAGCNCAAAAAPPPCAPINGAGKKNLESVGI